MEDSLDLVRRLVSECGARARDGDWDRARKLLDLLVLDGHFLL
ncbi:MAG TPA: hypothetical protein VIT46_05950 [Gaiellaceae bacterium]